LNFLWNPAPSKQGSKYTFVKSLQQSSPVYLKGRSGMEVMLARASNHSSVDLFKVWRIFNSWILQDRPLWYRKFQQRLFLPKHFRIWAQEVRVLPPDLVDSSDSDVNGIVLHHFDNLVDSSNSDDDSFASSTES
jgi:hypothetical protein